mmetsp:Transcript_80496/g.218180  ORF Transcript_80496/g.218180 Transcript_80496/m.218180 type:complete len:241 (+) Transcript_80496:81-803(+)
MARNAVPYVFEDAEYSDESRPSTPGAVLPLNAQGLPSRGSSLHAAGDCTRCCFFFKGRCRNDLDCQFCHLSHDKRSRGRGCRGHGTTKKMAAMEAAAYAAETEEIEEAPPSTQALAQLQLRPPPGLLLASPMVPPTAPLTPPGLSAHLQQPCATKAFLSTAPINATPAPAEASTFFFSTAPTGKGLAGLSAPVAAPRPQPRGEASQRSVAALPFATDLSSVNFIMPRSAAAGSLLATPAA